MRLLRWITVLLFVVVSCIYVGFRVYVNLSADTTMPVIFLPDEMLEVSISATTDELLVGVTAYDEKDGNISENVIVESISQFISDGMCEIIYAVSDSDCHVAKAKRKIRYTDYVPPRLFLQKPLVFSVGEKVDFRNIVGAYDCIDGNISEKITFVATDYTTTQAGVYTLSVQVTNSRGDNIYLDFPVYNEQNSKLAPQIVLKENLLYVKKGETPDFSSHVSEILCQDGPAANIIPAFTTDFDSNTPGMYTVDYYAKGDDGNVGHTVLTVIVEE